MPDHGAARRRGRGRPADADAGRRERGLPASRRLASFFLSRSGKGRFVTVGFVTDGGVVKKQWVSYQNISDARAHVHR